MQNKITKTKSLSLVIPCHNEELAIKHTLNIYNNLLLKLIDETIISNYEIIVVNNGSTDKTLDVLKKESQKIKITIVNLVKNFGYTSSYLAGMKYCKKEMIITVSADLHEDPAKVKELVVAHYKNNKPVLGIYRIRHTTFLKNFFSKFYYFFMNLIHIKIVNNHADFRLITNKINNNFFKNLPSFIFIRIRILEFIKDYEKIYYIGNDRKYGKTKFNFISSFLLAVDTILFYSKVNLLKLFRNLTIISLIFFFYFYLLSYNYFIIFVISLYLIILILFLFLINIRSRLIKNKKEHYIVKELIV